MKPTDLSIADCVYFNCFDGSKIIVKITAINNNGLVYGVSKYGSHWCNIDKVEPIPVTPEMLTKNGFKLTRKYILKIGTPKKQPIIAWNTWYDTPNLVIYLRGKESINISVPCKYVHTFLRALRLCGLDKLNKLADNFKLEE